MVQTLLIEFEEKFKKAIAEQKYSMATEIVLDFVYHTGKEKYLDYMNNKFNWIKYFRCRKYHLKKYGYFVYGRDYRQIIFQFVRPCQWLTMLLFKDTKNRPREFFHRHLEYEKRQQLIVMQPRAEEIFDHWEAYKKIGEILADEKSQRTYACILMAFVTMKFEYFAMANCRCETDYLPKDIFKDVNLTCMVDCGGYDGDTAMEVMQKYSQDIGSYYLIEADAENIRKAKSNLVQYSNIKYVEAAVAAEEGFVHFDDNGKSGSINQSGLRKVKAVQLDSAVAEKITHLKMDIEGSELAALKGAANHIKRDVPAMSICAYHKPEDIRELTEYVISVNPAYHVYLRNYGDKYKEIVLYFAEA